MGILSTAELRGFYAEYVAEALAAENLERGTHSGDLVVGGERLPPAGRRLELRGGLFMALDEDGRIAEISEYIDPGQFLVQLRPGIPPEQ